MWGSPVTPSPGSSVIMFRGASSQWTAGLNFLFTVQLWAVEEAQVRQPGEVEMSSYRKERLPKKGSQGMEMRSKVRAWERQAGTVSPG